MQLLRKISARTVFGSKADIQALVLADRTKAHPLFRVGGNVRRTRTGTTKDRAEETDGAKADNPRDKMRDWTALIGTFRALKTDGTVYQSAVCFLPNYVTDMITAQLSSDDDAGVDFVGDLYAKFDDNSATSYVFEFDMRSTIETAERIGAMLGAGIGRELPAPAQAAQQPAQSEPAPVAGKKKGG